ncbi:MAG: hypothetical protein B7Y95_14715 [Rhizobiales bacterium 32-66-11]|nr:MAG: hypothetical protein B7Y95_14715 [Rhizobiales bacterium 32-66-11]
MSARHGLMWGMIMRMKAEWEPQRRVYMCFGLSKDPALPKATLEAVREDLVMLARVIAKYMPVTMLFNVHDQSRAAEICTGNIEPLFLPHYDIWARDTLGVPLWSDTGELAWLDMNFNVWGERYTSRGFQADRELASLFARSHMGCSVRKASFVLEGGALDTDGAGTLMTTRSCVLHQRRNKDLDLAAADGMLRNETGARHVVWLPGYTGADDITRGHIDGIARFVATGVVVMEGEDTHNLDALKASRQLSGAEFTIVPIARPRKTTRGAHDADTYMNFLVLNGAVLVPAFGDEERDGLAASALAALFPDREIVPLRLDRLIAEGGGMHCVTLNA